MAKLDVKHYLGIYTLRKKMQDKGITNPSEEIKKFTIEFIEKLENMNLNDEIILEDNSFCDSSRKLIIKIPIKKL